jgi:hypothetical protein
MVARFDTCVYCIVLLDGSAQIEPHRELKKRAGTGDFYDCGACGSEWAYDSQRGWQREGARASR